MSRKQDKALLRAVMRGWDARSDSPSESIKNICEAMSAHIRRAKAKAWDDGHAAAWKGKPGDSNPYRGRKK